MAKYAVIFALIACALIISIECANPGPECGCTCKRNLKPVCGKTSDGELKTFGNECLLDCENRCFTKDFAAVELTDCSQ